ncbi:hypothetical protein [Schaalia suimastitidis]|uniref:hypothetical protein n=1 Tax=Schaalia suimastitidis TaxID=121163 RepID=UPI0004018B78|nr:hypothetical protein [Schaalia suimastitidis]
MTTIAAPPQARWKAVLKMMLNPGEVVKNQMLKVPWPLSLTISGLAFALFFLQTGLDMYRSGTTSIIIVGVLTGLGFVYGTVGMSLLALLMWSLSQAQQHGHTIGWAISTFALGYSATLIYSIFGLIFSLVFDWNTSVAFGVTGLLWALRPTMHTIKQMSGDRVAFSIAMTSLSGAILLFGWAALGTFAS